MYLKFLWIALLFAQASAVQITFEDFVQTLGRDYVLLDLRVRKYNRTLAVLNGTVDFLTPQYNILKFRVDIFHSRLGNQQFNHYPMKLPTQGVCDFLELLYERYSEQIAKFVNPPVRGECPVAARKMHLFDLAFPHEVVPPVVPVGLWKGVVTGAINNTDVISYNLVWRSFDWL